MRSVAKRVLLALALTCGPVVLVGALVFGAPTMQMLLATKTEGGGGGGTVMSDDFASGLGNWEVIDGSFSTASGALAQLSTGDAEDILKWTASTFTTGTQAIKFDLAEVNAGNWTVIVTLRSATDLSDAYYIIFSSAAGDFAWSNESGTIQTASISFPGVGNTTTYGATIAGTGNDTVLRLWINPTGDASTATSANWNGDTTPDYAFTNNPTNPVDTGSGTTVSIVMASASGDRTRLDNFQAADISP